MLLSVRDMVTSDVDNVFALCKWELEERVDKVDNTWKR